MTGRCIDRIPYKLQQNPGLQSDDAPRFRHRMFKLACGAVIGSEAEGWRIMLWGKNITDKYYIVSVLKGQDNVIAYAGRRFMFGVKAAISF